MTTMKTLPLSGRALELAKELAKHFEDQGKQLQALEAQMHEIRKTAHQQMGKVIESIKVELGLPKEAHLHVDATYLAEHGVAFGQLYEEPPENDNPFAEFLKEVTSPPTIQ
jgi:hypothetical protein